VRDKKVLHDMVTNFSKNLYTADQEVRPEEVVNLFQPVICEEMNVNLCKDFTDDEIRDALF
jgi:hypothetical protein